VTFFPVYPFPIIIDCDLSIGCALGMHQNPFTYIYIYIYIYIYKFIKRIIIETQTPHTNRSTRHCVFSYSPTTVIHGKTIPDVGEPSDPTEPGDPIDTGLTVRPPPDIDIAVLPRLSPLYPFPISSPRCCCCCCCCRDGDTRPPPASGMHRYPPRPELVVRASIMPCCPSERDGDKSPPPLLIPRSP